ncbi:MAG: penicillin-binding protein activator [Parvibaculum sp.]|uniref:penicillin-binding protein activator n=1 Tax=Parvibaculum sp. TaxID=2024848 RepID=UPI0034A04268
MTDARPSSSGLRAVVVLCFGLMLAACNGLGGRSAPPPVVAPPPTTQVQPPPRVDAPAMRDPARFYTPAHMAGERPIRVALLLPFNSPRDNVRTLSNSLYNAAQLALFEFDNRQILLIPKATGGTSGGAQRAAQEALSAGADLILGPLFAEEVVAVAPIAAQHNVPVVAFSSDSAVAGNGVYLLSFPLHEDINRIVEFATLQGIQSFGALYPQGSYGNRAQAEFERAVAARAGRVVAATSYPSSSEGMYEPARRIAASYGDGNFQALFLPEGGAQLKTISPLLPYYDLDPRQVKFLGTGLWDDPSLALEPPLHGAWFPAPPPEGHAQFLTRYKRAYGPATPPRIASLGYDAASLAVALATRDESDRFTAAALTDPDGFAGVDGIFRFMADGRTERGLAVMEVRPGGAVVVDPAPTSFRPQVF